MSSHGDTLGYALRSGVHGSGILDSGWFSDIRDLLLCRSCCYNIFLNTTKANPDDWDIGFGLSYKNFAALDGLSQKVLDLRMKQYGDKGKEQQVQNARVVTSVLTREITLK